MAREPNLPVRGIDHLVLDVRDLDAARAAYERLGFTLTPRAEHAWGTSNHLAQFDGNFLEILTVSDPSKVVPNAGRRFTFGDFNRRYLEQREGFAMLVFESMDARADHQEFAEKGLSDYDPFDFERKAKLPDGSEVTVGFSLAFVAPPEIPNAAFFVCQQHAPQYFWKPEYQKHENGATAVGEAVMVAEDPEALAPLFAGLQSPDAVVREDGAVRVATARGWVSALRPDVFRDWFGDTGPAPAEGPHFAAARIMVEDLGRTEALLGERGVTTVWNRAGLIVPASEMFGVALAFVQGKVDAREPVALLPPR